MMQWCYMSSEVPPKTSWIPMASTLPETNGKSRLPGRHPSRKETRKSRLPTIHYQVQAVSFREGIDLVYPHPVTVTNEGLSGFPTKNCFIILVVTSQHPGFFGGRSKVSTYQIVIISWSAHLANGPWKKSLNFIFPTKYGIPKSLKG